MVEEEFEIFSAIKAEVLLWRPEMQIRFSLGVSQAWIPGYNCLPEQTASHSSHSKSKMGLVMVLVSIFIKVFLWKQKNLYILKFWAVGGRITILPSALCKYF